MIELLDTTSNKEDKEEDNKGDNLLLKINNSMNSNLSKDVRENKKGIRRKIIINNVISRKDKYRSSKRKKHIINEFIGFIIFYTSYYLYMLSLEICLKGQEVCATRLRWQLKKVVEEIISCVLTVLAFELVFYKIISKFHLVHFFAVFSLFYAYTHDIEFHDHGYYNFIYFFIIIIIIFLLLLPLNLIIYFIQRKKRKKFLFIFIGFSIIIGNLFYLFFFVYGSKCNDWGKGLNNTSIINDASKYGCQIEIPKKCTYKPIYFFQDYTKILGKNCTKYIREKSKDNLIRKTRSSYISFETNRFGYPLSNKDPISIKEPEDDTLEKNFKNNLVDIDDKKILELYFKNKTPEVSVDFTNNIQGKIDININYNEKLSQERKILEKNSEPYSNNVLIIYIDAVSRQNAIRELRKTLSFFEKFMPYQGGFNQKYPEEIFHSFEFFKFHSFKGFTTNNFPLLFYGQERPVKNKILINKYFKENGYITSLAHDICSRDNARCEHEFTEEEVYDHEFILCDPNQEHINLNTIRCLYGKQNFEHLLDYTEQFWKKYSSNRKFSFVISNYGHEGTLQVIKYADYALSKFLTNLFNDNLLKDTTIILISDHGAHMPSLNYFSDFFQLEMQLPMFYMLINDRKKISFEEQFKYMRENQQILVNALDFYNTLCNIIYGDNYINIKNKTKEEDTCKSPYGISLFHKINSKDRYPKKYNNDMELFVCK